MTGSLGDNYYTLSSAITLAPPESRHMIYRAIAKLQHREIEIIMLCYGLGGFRVHTLEEVAMMFGISKQRVAQLEGRALTRLRELLNDDII